MPFGLSERHVLRGETGRAMGLHVPFHDAACRIGEIIMATESIYGAGSEGMRRTAIGRRTSCSQPCWRGWAGAVLIWRLQSAFSVLFCQWDYSSLVLPDAGHGVLNVVFRCLKLRSSTNILML